MGGMMDGMMGGMMNGNSTDWGGSSGLGGWLGGAEMFLMGIVPLLVIGVVIWLVVEMIRRNDGSRGTPSSVLAGYAGGSVGADQTPQQILAERYARGEIDREEFVQRRTDLAT